MLLNSGETVVRKEDVVPYKWGDTAGRGTVYLTTERIVIESPQHGFLQSGHAETVLDLPLRDVGNVAVGVVLRRARYIVVELAMGSLRLDVVDPPKWREAVSSAKASVPPPHARAPGTPTIERHIVKIRCRHCGTLSDEMLPRCASCGAAL